MLLLWVLVNVDPFSHLEDYRFTMWSHLVDQIVKNVFLMCFCKGKQPSEVENISLLSEAHQIFTSNIWLVSEGKTEFHHVKFIPTNKGFHLSPLWMNSKQLRSLFWEVRKTTLVHFLFISVPSVKISKTPAAKCFYFRTAKRSNRLSHRKSLSNFSFVELLQFI